MINGIIAAVVIAVVLRPAVTVAVHNFQTLYGIIAAIVFALNIWLAIKIGIIEVFVLHSTNKWYASIVDRLAPSSRLLDIGFGIAGVTNARELMASLVTPSLAHKSPTLVGTVRIALAKKLNVVCMEQDTENFKKAAGTMVRNQLKQGLIMHNASIYDANLPKLFSGEARFDAVCFSSPLMALPDPAGALRVAASLLKEQGGVLYIPVVLNSPPSSMMFSLLKPLFKLMHIMPMAEVLKVVKEADMEVLGDLPSVGVDGKRPRAARLLVLRPVACATSHLKQ